MEQKTVQYKRTLRGSVGAGVGALFNGNGRRYFILEHKDSSKYHRAGESQKIIIDQVELGRDKNCQVRFDDESFPTVSRRHAAIVREGDKWKLIQLSTTNSTFLNGKPVTTEWFLENGDEIQLSVGGPRIGFIVPQGKQSLVSSIKMTERLNLFRKQALRPYKAAIVSLFVLLVLLGCASGYVIHNQGQEIAKLWKDGKYKDGILAKLNEKVRDDSTRIVELENHPREKVVNNTVYVNPQSNDGKVLEQVKSSVFYVRTDVYIEIDGNKERKASCGGTGFLLNDGRFVTARHCVEPWMADGALWMYYALSQNADDVRIYALITIVNNENKVYTLNNRSFTIDRSHDIDHTETIDIGEGDEAQEVELTGKMAFNSPASMGSDWAVTRLSAKGAFRDGKGSSANLKAGKELHLLGFPGGNGVADGKQLISPIYNKLTVSRDGLNDSRCIMVNQGIDHGNSGGPAFYIQGGAAYVVGIVSRGDSNSQLYNHLVPMSNL